MPKSKFQIGLDKYRVSKRKEIISRSKRVDFMKNKIIANSDLNNIFTKDIVNDALLGKNQNIKFDGVVVATKRPSERFIGGLKNRRAMEKKVYSKKVFLDITKLYKESEAAKFAKSELNPRTATKRVYTGKEEAAKYTAVNTFRKSFAKIINKKLKITAKDLSFDKVKVKGKIKPQLVKVTKAEITRRKTRADSYQGWERSNYDIIMYAESQGVPYKRGDAEDWKRVQNLFDEAVRLKGKEAVIKEARMQHSKMKLKKDAGLPSIYNVLLDKG